MKKISLATVCGAAMFAASLFGATQGPAAKSAAEQQLTERYRLTTVSRSGEIVSAGSVLLLQKHGLLVYSISNPMAPQSTYKNGKISRNPLGGKAFGRDLINVMKIPGTSVDIDQRTLVAGASLWVTKVDIQKDGVVLKLYAAPEGGALYYGSLKVPFSKNSVPEADQLLAMVGEVLAVQTEQTAPVTATEAAPVAAAVAPAPPAEQLVAATPTISLGLSIDQVVAMIGAPDRRADLGTKQIYSYKDMKIIFVDGKVSDIQ